MPETNKVIYNLKEHWLSLIVVLMWSELTSNKRTSIRLNRDEGTEVTDTETILTKGQKMT